MGARYLERLGAASEVKDVLAIGGQMAMLRENIESAEGQLERLNNQIALSALELTYYENVDVPIPFGKYFSKGLGNGWDNLI